jgi:uncharacterized membrane protein
MNTRRIVNSALASAMALGLVAVATESLAQAKPKERCYGVAKKGLNDCGNLAGTHGCAGQARVDFDPGEWRYVPTGTCKALKGTNAVEAEAEAEAARRPAKGAYAPG